MKISLRRSVLAVAVLIGMAVQPSAARAQRGNVAAEAPAPDMETQAADYGRWLLDLNSAAAPAIAVIREFAPAFQRATAVSSADGQQQLVGFSETAIRTIDEAIAAVSALPTPDFADLDLPALLGTASLRERQIDQLTQMRAVVVSMPTLFVALAGDDPQAGVAATRTLLRSVRLITENDLTFVQANLAVTPVGTVEYHSLTLNVVFFETGTRVLDTALILLDGRRDTRLADDMRSYADRVDAAVAGLVTAVRERKLEMQAAASEQDAAEVQRISRQLGDIDRLEVQTVGIWRDFSASLRRLASQSTANGPSGADLRALSSMLAPMRAQLDAIGMQQAEVLADR